MSRASVALLPEAQAVDGPRSRFASAAALVGVLVAIATAVGILVATGQLGVAASGGFDSGALVRYGTPAVRVAHDLAAALSVGLLVLATWCVAPEPDAPGQSLTGSRRLLARAATVSATVWLASGAAMLVLTAAEVSGFRLTTPGFSGVLMSFVSQLDLGRALVASLLVVLL
ncbi:MAG TPA: hypothetical protein VF635_18235, partial [Propionibacteriaceae bacterium]